MYARILVPLDGSKLAERALPAAEELARLLQAPLHFIRVIDPAQWDLRAYGGHEPVTTQGVSSSLLTEESFAADAYLERMTRRTRVQGVGAIGEVRYGNAAREIVAMAQPGDLIVMSTHGRGGLARWFLGSVAEAIVRRSPVPVLLVRGDEHTAAGQWRDV